MRLTTPARLRAVGFLLLEVASVGALLLQRYIKDNELRSAVATLLQRARAL